MAKENDLIDINEEDIKEDDFSEDDLADDTIDWKEEALKLKGIAKRRATKLAKLKISAVEPKTEPPVKKQDSQTKDFDYGQLAYLSAKGIESDTELELVEQIMKDTGKELKEVANSKHTQGLIKELKEAEAVKNATPASPKRGATPTHDTVDYWLAKGALPPEDQTQLRRDVVNARIKQETSGNPFTSIPIIGWKK